MINNLKLSITSLVLFFVLVLPNLTQAASTSDLIIEMDPEYPEAGQNVNITIKSFAFDTDLAFFTWQNDSGNKVTGRGENEYQITVGSIGSITNIDLSIVAEKEKRYETSIRVIPGEVDLLVEGETYTPYWYQGLPLPSFGNTIKIVAVPELRNETGNIINKDSFIYEWSVNNIKRTAASGLGKDSFSFTKSPSGSEKVTVIVSTVDKSRKASSQINISGVNPSLGLYEIKPLSGITSVDIGTNWSPTSEEINIIAEPFYFSKESVENQSVDVSLDIENVGKQPISKSRFIQALSRENLSGEQIDFTVELNNPDKLFESLRRSFVVDFSRQFFRPTF